MAYRKKSRGRRRSKSGAKSRRSRRRRTVKGCRALDYSTRPNFFREVGPVVPGLKRNLRADYAGIGLDKCGQYRSDPIPCRYMPRSRVSTYAGLCKIRGRSRMNQKQLCAALNRRSGKRPLTKSCQLKRMSDVYDARMRACDAGDQKYCAPGMYRTGILKSIMKSQRVRTGGATLDDLKMMLSECKGNLEAEKSRHKMELTHLKEAFKMSVSGQKGDAKKSVTETYKLDVRMENDMHKARMKEWQWNFCQIKDTVKMAEKPPKMPSFQGFGEYKYAPTLDVKMPKLEPTESKYNPDELAMITKDILSTSKSINEFVKNAKKDMGNFDFKEADRLREEIIDYLKWAETYGTVHAREISMKARDTLNAAISLAKQHKAPSTGFLGWGRFGL